MYITFLYRFRKYRFLLSLLGTFAIGLSWVLSVVLPVQAEPIRPDALTDWIGTNQAQKTNQPLTETAWYQTTGTPPPLTGTVSPTVTSTLDPSCPGGTPVGWGTFTPSPLWLLECGDCFAPGTSTPTVTATFDATSYPTQFFETATSQYLTGTPTFTPTPLGICSSLPSVLIGTSASNFIYNNTHLVTGLNYNHFILDYQSYHTFGAVGNRISASGNFIVRCLSYSWASDDPYWGGGGKSTCGDFNAGWFVTAMYTDFGSCTLAGSDFYCSASSNGYFQIDIMESGYGYPHKTTVSADLIVSTTPNCANTVTPSPPTATPGASYCAVVPCAVDDPGMGFGFDLFTSTGEKDCSMGWDAFQVASYSVPKVTICFQPVEVGTVTLFGYSFNLGYIALALAAGFLWRFFRTV